MFSNNFLKATDYAKYLNDIELSIHSPLLMLSSGVPPYSRASLSLSDQLTDANAGIIARIFLGGDLEVGGGLTTWLWNWKWPIHDCA